MLHLMASLFFHSLPRMAAPHTGRLVLAALVVDLMSVACAGIRSDDVYRALPLLLLASCSLRRPRDEGRQLDMCE